MPINVAVAGLCQLPKIFENDSENHPNLYTEKFCKISIINFIMIKVFKCVSFV